MNHDRTVRAATLAVFTVLATPALLLASPGARAASPQRTAYWQAVPADIKTATYLVDWVPATGMASVTDGVSRASGHYTDDGVQRLVTLDSPSVKSEAIWPRPDDCGIYVNARTSLTRYAFVRTGGTDRHGHTEVHEEAQTVLTEGCNAGRIVASTSLSDAVPAQAHLNLSARPSMSDLVPGVQIAGFSSMPVLAVPVLSASLAQDIADLLPGGQIRFHGEGFTVPATVPYQFTADQWLMLGLPGVDRRYTRLEVNPDTGAETWMAAEFAAGAPQWTAAVLVTKAQPRVTPLTMQQAAHVWRSGLSRSEFMFFDIELYPDMTGTRVSLDRPTGGEFRTPLTWAFSGNGITQSWATRGAQVERTWIPIGDRGRQHWVMEYDRYVDNEGASSTGMARVNFYADKGPATPPAARAALPARR